MARKGTWKRDVLNRDKWLCHFCGCQLHSRDPRADDFGTIDHLTPLSRGGMTIECNVVASCKKCNQQKSNKTKAEFITPTTQTDKGAD